MKMNAKEIIEIENKHYMPVFTRTPIVLEKGEGAYVWDSEGKKYLDFFGGIAVNCLGHNNKRLVAAIAAQAAKLMHTSNLFYTEAQSALVKKLSALSGLERVFVCNSGAEANEGAIKLARKFGRANGGKFKFITTNHSFHGRTLATLTATGQPKYQKGYEPLPGGFVYVDYNDFDALAAAVDAETCAVILEPVQGEGGVIIPSADYLQKVSALCKEKNILLILDEVQTGVGRTGKMFAYEHSGITPDILTLAKGLGGGFPVGAFLAGEKVAAYFNKGDHGTTFGGNPLACAAANAALSEIENARLLENVSKMHAALMKELSALAVKFPKIIKEARGFGLLCALELHADNVGAEIVKDAAAEGLLINCTAAKVLRFAPPYIIGEEEVKLFADVMQKILEKRN